MEQARTKVRAIVLAITGGILALLVIRFILIFLAANQTQFLVKLVLDISGIFVSPFQSFQIGGVTSGIDANTLLAMVVYVVLGILISEVITGFMQESVWGIFLEISDTVFKVIEFLLICRIVLKLFAIKPGTGIFVDTIYNTTIWSTGILPYREVLGGILEVSTIIVLVIVVFADLAAEALFTALRERWTEMQEKREARAKVEVKKEVEVKEARSEGSSPAPAPVVVQTPPPAPQNITINVPMPPPAPPATPAERQVINVHVPVPTPQAIGQNPSVPTAPQKLNDAPRIVDAEVKEG